MKTIIITKKAYNKFSKLIIKAIVAEVKAHKKLIKDLKNIPY